MPRPKGLPKSGGRKRGSLNNRTITQQQQAKAIRQAAKEAGLTPLEYMLKVMRDPATEPHRRGEMAKAAAPYMHPRLQMIQGDPAKPLLAVQKINILVLARQVSLAARLLDQDMLQDATAPLLTIKDGPSSTGAR